MTDEAPAESGVVVARPVPDGESGGPATGAVPESAPWVAGMAGAVPLPSSGVVDITAPTAPGADWLSESVGAVDTGAPGPAPGSVPAVASAEPAAEPSVGPAPGPARHRRHHRRWWAVAAVVAVVLAAGGIVGAQRINRATARPVLVSSLPASLPVPGSPPVLPWPVIGQGAVSVPALGFSQQSGPEAPAPIASLTKMANAVVILRDHPLAPGSAGPTITITPGDAAQFDVDLDNDESNIPIQSGETLTERQMLEALMNQSANDIAYSLAVWDAGSEPAFVAKMNALAASLGAHHTHYVDASGFDPSSVSTAADCLRVAAAGMAIPAFAEIVGEATVSLPLVGTVHNIVTEIGSNGVVGVKSGYTSQAGGCMVLAAYRVVAGRSVLVLASALGQHVPAPVVPKPGPTTTAPAASGGAGSHPVAPTPTTTTTTVPYNDLEIEYPLRYTGPIVEHLLDASKAAVVPVRVATRGQALVSATASWGGTTHRVAAVTTQGAVLLGWPGQRVASVAKLGPVPPGAAVGTGAGHAFYALGQQIESVPLTLTRTLPEPSWWWRLVHN